VHLSLESVVEPRHESKHRVAKARAGDPIGLVLVDAERAEAHVAHQRALRATDVFCVSHNAHTMPPHAESRVRDARRREEGMTGARSDGGREHANKSPLSIIRARTNRTPVTAWVV
jgi:hypothetical protein